ncbi:MAG: TatD family hydrolase [Elusimicrobia bacterium]|nr:TatD family hydrolase [Elusimicrobiota bacterium]
MLIDTHAHLNDARFDEDREAVIDRALASGVGTLVEIADAPADWGRAKALCRLRPGRVYCTLGLHPYHAAQWRPGLEAELLAAMAPEVVAVGEVGLDYARCSVPRPVQLEAFRGMLAAAKAADRPVVVHCRDAFADLLPVLRERYGGKSPARRYHGVVHCFSGTEDEAKECAALGFALGADGPVTYPKNEPLRRALVAAGLSAVVLETDSPYLPPQSKRGKRCEPADVAAVAARLAEAFGVDAEALAAATTANARSLYGLPV